MLNYLSLYGLFLKEIFVFMRKMAILDFRARREQIRLENWQFSRKPYALSIKPEDIHMQSAYSTAFPGFIQ